VFIFGFLDAPMHGVPGKFQQGVFTSTVSAANPGVAGLRLPVFAGADPVQVELDRAEVALFPDGTGGYDMLVRGGFPIDQLWESGDAALAQMVTFDPASHPGIAGLLCSANADAISGCDLSRIVQPDLVDANPQLLSAGFLMHLSPCADPSCPPQPPRDLCHDRVRDGDETDIDCGGTCALRCAGGLACRTDADCASAACYAGSCRPPTCNDGVQDGFETGVDTGGFCP
jgi:hypothetical protein